MRKFKRIFFRLIYDVFCKHLPASNKLFFIGRLSKKLRASAAKGFVLYCGKNANIEHGATFSSKLSIGDNSGVGVNASIGGKCTIGNDVMMGPDCIIYCQNHKFDDISMPMCKQGHQVEKPVSIGDDVWIGGRVIILPGVNIGSHCIIGAGSVVTKDIPDWAIAAGNPAVVKKYRIEQPLNTTHDIDKKLSMGGGNSV